MLNRDVPPVFSNSIKLRELKVRARTEISVSEDRQDTLRILFFDNSGRIIRDYRFAEDKFNKKIKYNYSYVFDKNGVIVQKIDSTYSEVVKVNLKYDDIGLLVNEKEVNSRGVILREVDYEYDDLSRMIEANEVNLTNNCLNNYLFEYDSYNNLAKLSSKKSCPGQNTESAVFKFSYKYDNKYNMIEKQTLYPNGSFKNESYTYDVKGMLVKSLENLSRSEYNEYMYFYDESNNKIRTEKKEVAGDVINNITEVLTYKNGIVTEFLVMNSDGKIVTDTKFFYEYY